jgi:hypothetical protein
MLQESIFTINPNFALVNFSAQHIITFQALVSSSRQHLEVYNNPSDFCIFADVCRNAMTAFDAHVKVYDASDGKQLKQLYIHLTEVTTQCLSTLRANHLRRLGGAVGLCDDTKVLTCLATEVLMFQSMMVLMLNRHEILIHYPIEFLLQLGFCVNSHVMRSSSWMADDWELKNIIGVCLVGARAGEKASILIRCSAQ